MHHTVNELPKKKKISLAKKTSENLTGTSKSYKPNKLKKNNKKKYETWKN